MKKFLSVLLILSTLPLSGCGGIYANFREVEELLVLQTMGLDRTPGGVQLTLAASAKSSPDSSPVRLEGSGSTITMAMDQARNSSFEQELFFTNIESLLIGEDSARAGIEDYMSYVCQSPMLRIDIPVFIVRGGTAADCVIRSGDKQSSISDIVQGINESYEKRGDMLVFSSAEVIRSSQRHGSALICALELIPSSQSATGGGRGSVQSGGGSTEDSSQVAQQLSDSESAAEGGGASSESKAPEAAESPAPEGPSSGQENSASEEKFSPAPSGLAVLKNQRLCAWIEPEDVLGASFLLNRVRVSDLALTDSHGREAAIQINEGDCRVYPVWSEDGRLMRLDVSARASATVLEAESGEIDDDYAEDLSSALEKEIFEKISHVLSLSSTLGADFLGLGSRVEQRDPEAYRSLGRSFASLLPALELRVSVSAQLSRTGDLLGNGEGL